jgi:hypothetical protein
VIPIPPSSDLPSRRSPKGWWIVGFIVAIMVIAGLGMLLVAKP